MEIDIKSCPSVIDLAWPIASLHSPDFRNFLSSDLYVTTGTSVTLTYQAVVTGDQSTVTNTASFTATQIGTPAEVSASFQLVQGIFLAIIR